MKPLFAFLVAATLAVSIQAQMPVPASPEAAGLQKLKETNAALLKQQDATLVTLEEMKQTVQQLKIYTRRG